MRASVFQRFKALDEAMEGGQRHRASGGRSRAVGTTQYFVYMYACMNWEHESMSSSGRSFTLAFWVALVDTTY